ENAIRSVFSTGALFERAPSSTNQRWSGCNPVSVFCGMNTILDWVIGTGLFGVVPLLLGRWIEVGHRDCGCWQEGSREDPAVAPRASIADTYCSKLGHPIGPLSARHSAALPVHAAARIPVELLGSR